MLKTIRHLFQEEFADIAVNEAKKETAVETTLPAEEPVAAADEQAEQNADTMESIAEQITEQIEIPEENRIENVMQVTAAADNAAVVENEKADEMENAEESNKSESILELAIDEVQPNPFQPRLYFDPAQLEELSSSIREYGVLQPVIVRIVDGKYQLVSGERRFRASKLAEKETIPALVRQLSDREVAEMALIENLQREDLNYFEEAEGYARLIQEFHITQEEVAKKMGKSQPTIANKLRLLQISERVRREISVDVVTERHVRSLLKLKNEELQLDVLNRIYKNNMNVRQTDDYIETLLINEEKNIREQKKKKMMKAIKDMKIFVNTIKGTVKTIQDAGMAAEVTEKEDDDYLEVIIRLPKKDLNQKDMNQKNDNNAAG